MYPSEGHLKTASLYLRGKAKRSASDCVSVCARVPLWERWLPSWSAPQDAACSVKHSHGSRPLPSSGGHLHAHSQWTHTEAEWRKTDWFTVGTSWERFGCMSGMIEILMFLGQLPGCLSGVSVGNKHVITLQRGWDFKRDILQIPLVKLQSVYKKCFQTVLVWQRSKKAAIYEWISPRDVVVVHCMYARTNWLHARPLWPLVQRALNLHWANDLVIFLILM